MAAEPRAVVLCADDFAIHESASRGIVALANAGRLTATSAMVLSPRWRTDAALLQPLRGRIDVGLHLDFTSGFTGGTLGRAMLRAALGGFDEGKAQAAIDAQLDAFEQHWGAPPDHVDGHQHVQQFAGIRQALVHCIARRYRQRKPWLRISRARGAGLKGAVITAMGARALERAARGAGVPCSGALTGLYGFDGDAAGYARRLQQWLADAPQGAVLMCHPAAATQAADEIGAARKNEFDVLAGEALPQVLQRAGVRLAKGSGLFR